MAFVNVCIWIHARIRLLFIVILMFHISAFQPLAIFVKAGLPTVDSTVMRWAAGDSAAAASCWVQEELSPPDTEGLYLGFIALHGARSTSTWKVVKVSTVCFSAKSIATGASCMLAADDAIATKLRNM